jgi:hypothetical protein
LLGFHWKTGFWIFGGVGLAWCLAFAFWFRNTPEEHPAANQAERDLIAYVCINYGWYFFMYFLPDFLKKQFAGQTGTLEDRMIMAILAGGPLLVGVAAAS